MPKHGFDMQEYLAGTEYEKILVAFCRVNECRFRIGFDEDARTAWIERKNGEEDWCHWGVTNEGYSKEDAVLKAIAEMKYVLGRWQAYGDYGDIDVNDPIHDVENEVKDLDENFLVTPLFTFKEGFEKYV